MRLSICIPHRSENLMGLWATISACELAIDQCPHEYIVCINGRDKVKEHDRYDVQYLECDPVGPAKARELCAAKATGDFLLFLDDHVILHPNSLKVGLKLDKDVLFFPAKCPSGTYYDYEVELSVLTNMDATIRTEPRHEYPYRCLSAPHGQFMVKRSAWDKMGGYGGIFDGYSGEEVYFGMRAAMFNLECWMHPMMPAFHYVPSIADNWKNRDDAFFARFEKGLTTLKELQAERTLEDAFEQLAGLNQGLVCI